MHIENTLIPGRTPQPSVHIHASWCAGLAARLLRSPCCQVPYPAPLPRPGADSQSLCVCSPGYEPSGLGQGRFTCQRECSGALVHVPARTCPGLPCNCQHNGMYPLSYPWSWLSRPSSACPEAACCQLKGRSIG